MPVTCGIDQGRRRTLATASLALGALALPNATVWAQRTGPATDRLAWPPAPAPLAAQHQRAWAGLSSRIEVQLPDVQSLAVLHRGHLAHEFYRAGVTADTLQDTQSVTKSVLALLFGQAQADGHVRGPDELVAQRLPQMLRVGADARVQRLRFAHLLTMTAGWKGDQTAQRDRDDDLAQIVRRPFVAQPGERFAYDNGSANLLALALASAVGQPLADYARARLFEPLGIRRFAWRQGAQGRALGALGLSLSTRAMARLGELVLAQGQWQDHALVPTAFVRAATERQSAGGYPLGAAYGYLWWLGASAPRRTAMANGYGGQWIYVHPPLDLVVAVTSRRTPESAARGQGLSLIERDIVPTVQHMR
ncbi:serine hydrolase domain-containing protein [Ottowia testudinis]|uniref:Serine hydrolase n=1 Tax=Ottowia testudinis TaxID=2816950 RepID=A0A975H7C1_9BURK|nr:serine hydrolase [Ottowia testudinis]QTD46892.1 serine hydrolase [Ottowia testudinis]